MMKVKRMQRIRNGINSTLGNKEESSTNPESNMAHNSRASQHNTAYTESTSNVTVSSSGYPIPGTTNNNQDGNTISLYHSQIKNNTMPVYQNDPNNNVGCHSSPNINTNTNTVNNNKNRPNVPTVYETECNDVTYVNTNAKSPMEDNSIAYTDTHNTHYINDRPTPHYLAPCPKLVFTKHESDSHPTPLTNNLSVSDNAPRIISTHHWKKTNISGSPPSVPVDPSDNQTQPRTKTNMSESDCPSEYTPSEYTTSEFNNNIYSRPSPTYERSISFVDLCQPRLRDAATVDPQTNERRNSVQWYKDYVRHVFATKRQHLPTYLAVCFGIISLVLLVVLVSREAVRPTEPQTQELCFNPQQSDPLLDKFSYFFRTNEEQAQFMEELDDSSEARPAAAQAQSYFIGQQCEFSCQERDTWKQNLPRNVTSRIDDQSQRDGQRVENVWRGRHASDRPREGNMVLDGLRIEIEPISEGSTTEGFRSRINSRNMNLRGEIELGERTRTDRERIHELPRTGDLRMKTNPRLERQRIRDSNITEGVRPETNVRERTIGDLQTENMREREREQNRRRVDNRRVGLQGDIPINPKRFSDNIDSSVRRETTLTPNNRETTLTPNYSQRGRRRGRRELRRGKHSVNTDSLTPERIDFKLLQTFPIRKIAHIPLNEHTIDTLKMDIDILNSRLNGSRFIANDSYRHDAVHRGSRQKRTTTARRDVVYHACCKSYIERGTTPTFQEDIHGVTREVVQMDNFRQYFDSHVCQQVPGCSGCHCTQHTPIIQRAVVYKNRRAVEQQDRYEVTHLVFPGCCQCINVV